MMDTPSTKRIVKPRSPQQLAHAAQMSSRNPDAVAARQEKAAERRAAILEFVDAFWKAHYYAPSIHEIAQHVGISTSQVSSYLGQLCRDGVVHWEPNTARAIVPAWVRSAIDNGNGATVQRRWISVSSGTFPDRDYT